MTIPLSSTLGPTRPAEVCCGVAEFRRVAHSRETAAYAKAARDLRRWLIATDPHRPRYHFTGPESWINDPNGPIYYRGRYHLFYQFDPIVEDKRHARCWGHAVSPDLVHWEDWPVAMWPDTPQDRAGVYSGNTFVDADGSLCALYTGNVNSRKETYGILARSTDEGLTWRKQVVMADAQRPNPESPVHWDGFVWKQGDTWQQLIGGASGGSESHGVAWLWTSPDLVRWTLQNDIAPSIRKGPFWELPYLLPFPTRRAVDRHVLMVGFGNPYWIGTYDPASMIFTPTTAERSIDVGDYYSFNPNMVDDKGPGGSPRRLMHGWVMMPPSPTTTVPYWQNAHSIPRVISLRGDRLIQEPIPELQVLRGPEQEFPHLVLAAAGTHLFRGDALEILATFAPGAAARIGFHVRAAAPEQPGIPVWFDTATREFGIGARHSPSDLAAGERVTFHLFIDRSIIELYLNGHALTHVTYTDPTAQDVRAFAEGGAARLESGCAWPLRSAWGNL